MAEKEKKTVLTQEGYKKLEAELEYYTSVRRNEIADQIAFARGFGDLSENAEYDEAKNEQSRIEAKIVEMENTLRNCVVISDEDVNNEVVGVGNTVKVKYSNAKQDAGLEKFEAMLGDVFSIVGANESDPMAKKLSCDSPIGAQLLGKKVGQTVSVEVPAGIIKMKILEITR